LLAAAYLASHLELVDAYSWGNVAHRLQSRVSAACQDACLRVCRPPQLSAVQSSDIMLDIYINSLRFQYKDFLKAEVDETKELFSLLKKGPNDLTEEEKQKVSISVGILSRNRMQIFRYLFLSTC
jgi:hypothetical protein